MTVFPRVGESFAGYRLDGVLGRGGMSTVFRAENVRLGNIVALKVLSPELADDDQFRERFVRESRVASSMNHPNIIPITDAGQENEHLYIVMRFVNGSDLKSLLHREGRLDPTGCLEIISQVASALDAAHAKELLHRDVKPANILLESSGVDYRGDHVYLADFGLIKHTGSTSGLTKTGHFVGTIDYMAPEQIETGSADGRADIYALGCVTFECLTGSVPFVRDSDAAVLWAHLRDDLPKATDLRPELSARVDDVIARALAKSPDDRYQGARELVVDLSEALGAGRSPRGLGTVQAPKAPTPAASLVGESPPLAPSAPLTSETTSSPALAAPLTGGAQPPLVPSPPPSDPAREAEPPAPDAGDGPGGRSRLPGWLLVAIVAVGAAAVSGIAVYLATGSDSPSGNGTTTTGTTPTVPGAVVGPDTGLAELVEPTLFKTCTVDPTPRFGASESAKCGRPSNLPPGRFYPESVDLAVFESSAALKAAYDEQRQDLGIGRNYGRCTGRAWNGEGDWDHADGKPAGRRFCQQAGNVFVIVWTHDKLGQPTHKDFLGIARGLDHPRLFNWWDFWHHTAVGRLGS